jgi:hypothetical protein
MIQSWRWADWLELFGLYGTNAWRIAYGFAASNFDE